MFAQYGLCQALCTISYIAFVVSVFVDRRANFEGLCTSSRVLVMTRLKGLCLSAVVIEVTVGIKTLCGL
jgi:hypothetical protein